MAHDSVICRKIREDDSITVPIHHLLAVPESVVVVHVVVYGAVKLSPLKEKTLINNAMYMIETRFYYRDERDV